MANAPPPKASGTSDPSREPARVVFATAPVTLLVDHPDDNPPDVVINPVTGNTLRVQPVGNPVGATESVLVAESGPVGTESGPTIKAQIDAYVAELPVDYHPWVSGLQTQMVEIIFAVQRILTSSESGPGP